MECFTMGPEKNSIRKSRIDQKPSGRFFLDSEKIKRHRVYLLSLSLPVGRIRSSKVDPVPQYLSERKEFHGMSYNGIPK